jgi:hypothetical protein
MKNLREMFITNSLEKIIEVTNPWWNKYYESLNLRPYIQNINHEPCTTFFHWQMCNHVHFKKKHKFSTLKKIEENLSCFAFFLVTLSLVPH